MPVSGLRTSMLLPPRHKLIFFRYSQRDKMLLAPADPSLSPGRGSKGLTPCPAVLSLQDLELMNAEAPALRLSAAPPPLSVPDSATLSPISHLVPAHTGWVMYTLCADVREGACTWGNRSYVHCAYIYSICISFYIHTHIVQSINLLPTMVL